MTDFSEIRLYSDAHRVASQLHVLLALRSGGKAKTVTNIPSRVQPFLFQEVLDGLNLIPVTLRNPRSFVKFTLDRVVAAIKELHSVGAVVAFPSVTFSGYTPEESGPQWTETSTLAPTPALLTLLSSLSARAHGVQYAGNRQVFSYDSSIIDSNPSALADIRVGSTDAFQLESLRGTDHRLP